MSTVDIFFVNKQSVLTSLDEYFSATVSSEFCIAVCSTHPWNMTIFSHKYFTRYCSDTFEVS